ncbi:hypothetical protein FG05_35422 [Fusarium graminearum]|nr:hypothetical protein FG05_35422 [Fusarium graminearum]
MRLYLTDVTDTRRRTKHDTLCGTPDATWEPFLKVSLYIKST